MNSDTVACRLFKIHSYETIKENNKYIIEKCAICNVYKVTYKAYNITCKFKPTELPKSIAGVL